MNSNAHLFGSKSQQHWQEIEHLSHHSGPAEDSNCISENCMWLFHEAYLEQTNKQTNLFIQPVLLFIMLIFLSEIPLQEKILFQSACQFLGQPYINSLRTFQSRWDEQCLSFSLNEFLPEIKKAYQYLKLFFLFQFCPTLLNHLHSDVTSLFCIKYPF